MNTWRWTFLLEGRVSFKAGVEENDMVGGLVWLKKVLQKGNHMYILFSRLSFGRQELGLIRLISYKIAVDRVAVFSTLLLNI